MQTSIRRPSYPLRELFVTLFLGLTIGGVASLFLKSLDWIEAQQVLFNAEKFPPHLFFIPFVLVFLHFLKKRTLYFPVKVSEVKSRDLQTPVHWNRFMPVFQFFGTLASHAVGVSVGRESALVMTAAGVVRAVNLSWVEWGPVAMGCGFSAILGNPWIGVIFITELLTTSGRQKLNCVVASLFAYYLMQALHVHHLFTPALIQDNSGFWSKFFFVITLALLCGFLMRLYKWSHHQLVELVKLQPAYFKFICAIFLAAIFFQPEFRKYQSLGIAQISDLKALELGFHVPLIKLFLTLLSVGLGFWGGEFIPLVYTGVHFGTTLAAHFEIAPLLGAYFAAYLFFAGATRLKWTVFFLTSALLGWEWSLWILFLVNLAVGFSGELSLYEPHD